MNNFASLPRGGMQVHAVPDIERFEDASGKKYPWAYVNADAHDLSPTRPQRTEQGPFGRSKRRRGTSRSRSKTAEPRREEDRVRAENIAAEEAIFGRLRAGVQHKEESTERGEANQNGNNKADVVKVPTEVLLYGFGEDFMWAAIDWYERVSNGIILEDYERQPPNKQEPLVRSLSRATANKSISKASMRRKNMFIGGSHWIKVTYDSAGAADLAIASSPNIIKGHLVYAEPYRGAGPAKDEAIFASGQGAQITSSNMPTTFSANPQDQRAGDSPLSNHTLSSATVHNQEQPQRPAPQMQLQPRSTALQSQQGTAQQRPSRIQGATRAVVLPAEQALLPRQSRQAWSAWVGSTEVVGSALPKREDGSFDWDQAGLYWRIFFWIDLIFGTDLCGLKGDD